MRRPTVPQRCHSCGSLVTLEANRIREDTTLSFRCPGCGSLGTSCYGDFPLEEARRLAEQQNALAATPEAVAESESWKPRVAEWVTTDSVAFLDLVRKRFPEWREELTYQTDPYLDGAYTLTIPSQNSIVEAPLRLTVANNEVLISWLWGWHLHVFRSEEDRDDRSHLARAVKSIADLVEERLITGTHFVDGEPSGGGSIVPGQGIPGGWKETLLRWQNGKSVSIIARSWCGTYDEEWHSDSTGGEPVTQAT